MLDLGFILKSLVSCPFHIIEVDDIDKQKFEAFADYSVQFATGKDSARFRIFCFP